MPVFQFLVTAQKSLAFLVYKLTVPVSASVFTLFSPLCLSVLSPSLLSLTRTPAVGFRVHSQCRMMAACCLVAQLCPSLCDPLAHQAPLSMGLSRKEYWSGLACPPPGGLPDPLIEFMSFISPELAGKFFTTSTTHFTLFYLFSFISICGKYN